MRHPATSRVHRSLIAAATTALVLAAAGCGTDSEASDGPGASESSVAEAQDAVAALEEPVAFTAPGPAFDASVVKGGSIAAIVSGESAPFVQQFIEGLEDAAAELGATVTVQDSAYDSTKAAELIDKAVASGASAIVTQSVDSTAVSAAISGARDAGIPVIEATSRDAGPVPDDLADIGVSAISSFCYTCAGASMAQYAFASSDEQVNAMIYRVPGVVVSDSVVTGFTDELERLCPDCEVTEVEAPAADWEANLATLTTSNLQTNPDINTLVPVFDAMVGLIEPAMAASGLSGVSIVTYNATQPALQMLAEENLVTGDVGNSPAWLGWASIDQAARLLAGESAVDDVQVPARLFNATNVADLDLDGSQQEWYGDIDLPTEYRALWQLS
jgi:ribose transport system substrate-binding protein